VTVGLAALKERSPRDEDLDMGRGRALAIAVVLGAVVAAGPASAAPVPGTHCRVFPANDVWNLRIGSLPVDPMSDTWLAAMHADSTDLHPDFGPPRYGLPFTTVGRDRAKVEIRFRYAAESDPGPYPFDGHTPIERGSDRHAIVVEHGTCRLFELFDARWKGGAPRAGSGAIWDLDSNRLRTDGWTSADAAGLPILPGLVRWDEVRAGRIAHAIRFTVACTTISHIWPARHDAGVNDPSCPPMGARFRLSSSFDLSGFSPKAKAILRAMQRFGMILADNGSDWYLQGTVDRHWKNSLLDQLKTVPASAFEAVDESSCMVTPDSGRADCP
jgi:hypothetical protein